MIVVTGSITMLEGAQDAMREASSTMLAASKAEPGCREYRYAIDMEDPQKVVFTEVWEDMAALRGHMASPHMAAFREATMPLVAGRPEMMILEGEETSFG